LRHLLETQPTAGGAMRANVLAWFLLTGAALLAFAPAYAENVSTSATSADRKAVDAYLDQVAEATAEPGVFVDPLVLDGGEVDRGSGEPTEQSHGGKARAG
jgi:hypothetical protein